MNTMIAGIIGGWEIILILAVVLILFGAKKLPELAKGLGQGIKEFKKATKRSDGRDSKRAGGHDFTHCQAAACQPAATRFNRFSKSQSQSAPGLTPGFF